MDLEADPTYGADMCLTCPDNTESGKNNGREKEAGKDATTPG